MTGLDRSTAQLSLNFAVDDSVQSITLDGNDTGITGGALNAFTPATISSGFVSGANTLVVAVNNSGTAANPTGFRAELSGTATSLPIGQGFFLTFEDLAAGTTVTIQYAALGI